MTAEAPQILLRHHLKQLRLPTFKGEYAKQAQLCAAENKDHIQYLARLCEMELIDRERRMIERRIKAAKFPSTKSLDSFDFKIIPSLNKPLTFLVCREELLLLGIWLKSRAQYHAGILLFQLNLFYRHRTMQ